MTRKVELTQEILDEIIRRIVEVAEPERIILFGSAAFGKTTPDSDVDLLVVKTGNFSRRKVAQSIHCHLFGIPLPVDVVVATPEDIARFGDSVGSILRPALREGRVIYARTKTRPKRPFQGESDYVRDRQSLASAFTPQGNGTGVYQEGQGAH